MKRTITALLLLALLVSLAGCGGGTDASDKAVSVGKQAIKTVDDYLDGEIDYDTASDKLDDLSDEMEYVNADGAEEDEDHAADFAVSCDLVSISHDLIRDHFDKDKTAYDNLVEARNSLAEDIGAEKR